jgi:hypothetical protein
MIHERRTRHKYIETPVVTGSSPSINECERIDTSQQHYRQYHSLRPVSSLGQEIFADAVECMIIATINLRGVEY